MKFLLSCLLIVLSSHAYASEYEEWLKPENLLHAWTKARVYHPDSFLPDSISYLTQPRPYSVLVYLHGCAGLNEDSSEWARTIKALGFIVIQPDSFAIPGRRSNCDGASQTGQLLKGFDSFVQRNAELRLVRDELRKVEWLDKGKLYLMGHSEGGMTVSRSGVGGFKAVIASGFWCHKKLEVKHGNAPFLFLNWEVDPWYRSRSENRNPQICQTHVNARSNTEQLLLAGEGHATSGSYHAREAVTRFLKEHASK